MLLVPAPWSVPRAGATMLHPEPFPNAVPASQSLSQTHRLLFCGFLSSACSSSSIPHPSSRGTVVFMLNRNEKERSGVEKLRQASLMEETGEDNRDLAGPQHSQCWHTPYHTPGGAAGFMWAPGMFNRAAAMAHSSLKWCLQPLK